MSSWGVTCKRERGGAPLYKSQGTLHASRKIKIKHLREINVSHAEWDQNLQFTPLSETTSISVTLIWGPPDPRVACGHEAFRVIEREWKKARQKKTETNKQKQVNTGMSTSPVLLWGTHCLKLFTIDEKKRRKNCNSNSKTYSATRATKS